MRQLGAASGAGFPAITTTKHPNKHPKKHKSTAGKVLLAAIVHHDTINEPVASQSSDRQHTQKLVDGQCKRVSGKASNANSDKFEGRVNEKSSLRNEKKRNKKEKEVEERNKQTDYMSNCIEIETSPSTTPIKTKIKAAINACYTHENSNNVEESRQADSNDAANSGGRRKFSKLFSKKRKTPAKTAATTTLIDNSNPSKRDQQLDRHHQIPPTKMTKKENSNQVTSNQQVREQVDKQQINVCEERQASSCEKIFENDREQVIEFKFDLIVNEDSCETNEESTITTTTTKTRGQKKQFNCNDCDHDNVDYDNYDVNCNVDSSDRESRLMNCKLDDNVNELVESFILDSSDVCFMSTGKQKSERIIGGDSNKFPASANNNDFAADTRCCNEFDYLNKLLLHTLTYSFQLLEVKKRRRRSTMSKLGNDSNISSQSDDELANLFINNTELNFLDLSNNKCTLTTESYSIEMSATLLLNTQSTGRRVANKRTERGSISNKSADDDDDEDAEQPQTPTQDTLCNYYILDLLSNDDSYLKQIDELISLSNKTLSLDEYLAKINCDFENNNKEQQTIFDDDDDNDPRVASTTNQCGSGLYKIYEQSSIDCASIEEGLKLAQRIRDRLEQLESSLKMHESKQRQAASGKSSTLESISLFKPKIINNKLLIIGLKLKEKIDSGLFSNRMCLIDFDPNFIEMHSVFESIFNGQALAYLKRHKLHLKELESRFNGLVSNLLLSSSGTTYKTTKATTTSERNGIKTNLNSLDTSSFRDYDDLVKQHHQVASQSKLIQAEWIIYKQLSSALIRTLMIVHVHRLTNIMPSTIIADNNDREYYEQYLMKENLIVLKFARSIQRASALRLKRRKRHLKSHLASSNVSIASNASATTNDMIFNNLSLNSQKETLHFDCYTTTTPPPPPMVAGDYYSPHFYRNEPGHLVGIDTLSNLAIRNLHNNKQRIHSERTRQHEQQYYSQSRRPSNNKKYHVEPISNPKGFQNNCQQSDLATTESSSMSTSSGSQTRQIQSSRSSRRRDFDMRDNFVNNYSDSDSITSANLNSCSSSSFNRLQHSSLSHHNNRHQSHHNYHHHRSSSKQRRLRRDIELKWIAKQFSSRPLMQEQELLRRYYQHHHPHDKQTASQSPSHIELADFQKMSPTQRSSSVSRVPRNSSQVIQIDCSPTNTDNNLSSLSLQHLDEHSNSRMLVNGDDTTLIGVEDNTDNVSDICSIVAEPPKQLKLEEFLNQLSSIIVPSSNITGITQDKCKSTQNNGNSSQYTMLVEPADKIQNKKKNFQGETRVPNSSREDFRNLTEMMCKNRGIAQQQMAANRFELNVDNSNIPLRSNLNVIGPDDTPFVQIDQNNVTNTAVNEDDEDCKSHSSILEQLSSLALESNTRLNNRNQHQHNNNTSEREQLKLSDVSDLSTSQEHFVLQPLNCSATLDGSSYNQPLNSQQTSKIPKTTGHLQKLLYNSSQLPRKITQSRVTVRDPSSVEERLKALSISCQAPPASPSASSSGAFTLSTDSSCSSSSSSAENNTQKRGTANNLVSTSEKQSGTMGEQYLYASVIRSRQNVNI